MNFSNFIIFFAELLGTFGLVVAATGSIVYDSSIDNIYGPIFVAFIHFIGLATVVYAFGKYSMAHFNPAVTIGFFISGYLHAKKIPLYFSAQFLGAIFGTFFVKIIFGNFADLGLNFPNYSYPIILIFLVEIIATVLLMGVILTTVHIKGLNKFVSLAVGGIVALDVYFLGPISGASMNPIRSLSPALFTGITSDLWIYWSAPFIGAVIVGIFYHKKFSSSKIKNS
ncbi:MAG TPA: aquaporin [Nitrosopumilaceae archaeon]|nr:aquaporin [Nitrosopumilaceae archaeon]